MCVPCSLRLLDARAVSDALLENCLPKSVISDALRSAEVTSSDADHANARTFEVHREVTVRDTSYPKSDPHARGITNWSYCAAGTLCGYRQLHQAVCRNEAS